VQYNLTILIMNCYQTASISHRLSTRTREQFCGYWYAFAVYAYMYAMHSASTWKLFQSAQLQGTPKHSPKLHQKLCNSVGMHCQTDTQTEWHRDAGSSRTYRLMWQKLNTVASRTRCDHCRFGIAMPNMQRNDYYCYYYTDCIYGSNVTELLLHFHHTSCIQ